MSGYALKPVLAGSASAERGRDFVSRPFLHGTPVLRAQKSSGNASRRARPRRRAEIMPFRACRFCLPPRPGACAGQAARRSRCPVLAALVARLKEFGLGIPVQNPLGADARFFECDEQPLRRDAAALAGAGERGLGRPSQGSPARRHPSTGPWLRGNCSWRDALANLCHHGDAGSVIRK